MHSQFRLLFCLLTAGIFLAVAPLNRALAQACPISIASLADDGAPANRATYYPDLSADGNIVVFMSDATNLVEGDLPDTYDVFTHNRATGANTRVTVSSAGVAANSLSQDPVLSANGQVIAFYSLATNLVANDTNWMWDVFIHDQTNGGQTTRVSVAGDLQANGDSYGQDLSGDGRYVVFESTASNLVIGDTNQVGDVFIHDRTTRQTTLISHTANNQSGNGPSGTPAISADGKVVAFTSAASDLMAGDTNNTCLDPNTGTNTANCADIFVYDVETQQITRASVGANGVQANGESGDAALSSDGRYVVFESAASNLVSSDTNGSVDVFVHDRVTHQTARVSVSSLGGEGTRLSHDPAISGDGRYVVFSSEASTLVTDDTNQWEDVFVHDRQTRQTARVSVALDGTQGNRKSILPVISADGRFIAFHSEATNLVPNDTNGFGDIFVSQRSCPVDPPAAAPQRNVFEGQVLLTWSPVPWALQYRLQLAADRDFVTKADKLIAADVWEQPLELTPGTYYWRVQAQKPDGSWGGWSVTETFIVR